MNILLIAPRYLPIFNKNNEGAIEKLEQIYLRYSESTEDTFTIYSPKIAKDNYDHISLKNSTFRVVDKTALIYKFITKIYAIKRRLLHSKNNECYIRQVIKDLVRRKEQNKYDLIIFENGEQDIPIFKKNIETKSKIVLHLHNDYINKETKNSRAIIEACDEIWTVSEFLAERILEVEKTKIIVIPNTIKQYSDKRKARKNDKETKGAITFLYIGRILESKGVIELINAFNELSMLKPKNQLVIIGKTQKGYAGKKLKKKINKLTKNNKNIHITGYVRPEKLLEYQKAADYQIIPSKWNEAFGLVVLEAMAANLKIIATKSGGIPEIGLDKIEYVDLNNLEQGLLKKMNEADNIKLPNNYYANILRKYTEKNFCNSIYEAIHSEGEK